MHGTGSKAALAGVRGQARPEADDQVVRPEAGAVCVAAGQALPGVRGGKEDVPPAATGTPGREGETAGKARKTYKKIRGSYHKEPKSEACVGSASKLMDQGRLLSAGPLAFWRISKRSHQYQMVIVDESPRSWATFLVYAAKNPEEVPVRAKHEPEWTILHSDLRRILATRAVVMVEKKAKTTNKKGCTVTKSVRVAEYSRTAFGETTDAWYVQADVAAAAVRRVVKVGE